MKTKPVAISSLVKLARAAGVQFLPSPDPSLRFGINCSKKLASTWVPQFKDRREELVEYLTTPKKPKRPDNDKGASLTVLRNLSVSHVHFIDDPAQAAPIIQRLTRAPLLALDIETYVMPQWQAAYADTRLTGDTHKKQLDACTFDPYRTAISVMSVYVGGDTAWVFDIDRLGIDIIAPLVQRDWIAHHAIFELKHFVHAGLMVSLPHCTRLMAGQLKCSPLGLGNCALKWLKESLPKEGGGLAKSDWSLRPLTSDQIAYSAMDSVVAYRLYERLGSVLKVEGGTPGYEMLRAVQSIIAQQELFGVRFDSGAHRTALLTWQKDFALSQARFHKETGIPFSGTKALMAYIETTLSPEARATWPKTPSGTLCTDKKTLKRHPDYPWTRLLLDCRHLEKFCSTYGADFASTHVNPVTGKIHANFRIRGADTFRFSSSSPNLQNQPKKRGEKDPDFRRLFLPDPDHVFVVADYNQLELRILALLANDPTMLAILRDPAGDMHEEAARLVTGRGGSEVRIAGKVVNFGIAYCCGPAVLASTAWEWSGGQLRWSEAQARNVIDKWLARFPRVRAWRAQQMAKRESYIDIPGGLRRYIDFGDRDAENEYHNFGTLRVNTPIQGAAAVVMYKALLNIFPFMDQTTQLVLHIHDEVVIQSPKDQCNTIKQAVTDAMTDAFSELFPHHGMSSVVDAKLKETW